MELGRDIVGVGDGLEDSHGTAAAATDGDVDGIAPEDPSGASVERGLAVRAIGDQRNHRHPRSRHLVKPLLRRICIGTKIPHRHIDLSRIGLIRTVAGIRNHLVRQPIQKRRPRNGIARDD